MNQVRNSIEVAVEIVGSQCYLARLCDVTPQALNQALKRGRVSPRLAKAIEKATGGKVGRRQLLPDAFEDSGT